MKWMMNTRLFPACARFAFALLCDEHIELFPQRLPSRAVGVGLPWLAGD
jgi:hypothetical protein